MNESIKTNQVGLPDFQGLELGEGVVGGGVGVGLTAGFIYLM